MAKIGSANIALLRPEFEESNKLLTEGLKGMWESGDPLKTAIDGNINYLQQERVGQLQNMLQGILPQDPSDPKAMQEYMQQATNMAQENGFNKWGINAGGVVDTANALVDKNLEVDKLQGANTKANLENTRTEEMNQLQRAANVIGANKGTNDDIMKYAADNGLSVDAAKYVLDGQEQAVNIAGTVQKSNTDLIASQNALEQLLAAAEANNGFTTAQQKQEISQLMGTIERMLSPASGGGVGKSQGVSSGSTGTTNSSNGGNVQSFGADIDKDLADTVNRFGVNPEYMRGLLSMEGGTKGQQSSTGALGVGQFVQKTWNNLAKTPEGKAIGMTPINNSNFRKDNDPRKNNRVNMLATGLLTKQNQSTLERNGIPITPANLYMSHNMGPGLVLAAYGKIPTTAQMKKNMVVNGGNANMSAKEFLDFQSERYNNHYAKSNGGASPGSEGGGSNFNASEFIDQLQLSSGNPNTTANTNELLQVLRDRAEATNTLNESSPRIDLDSAALPSFIGSGTGSASDAMKLFEPQNQFMKDDAKASMGAITSSNEAQIADIEASGDMLKYNSSIETEFDTRLREAREAAAANGGNIPISALIGGEKDRLESGKAALIQAGFTKEKLATLPAKTKTIIFRSLNKYLDKVDSNQNTNSLQVEREQQGAIGNLEKFPDNYKKDAVALLDEGIKEDAVDWLEEETKFDAGMKWGARHGTLGVLGAVSDIGVSADKRISNLNALHTYMTDKAVDVLMGGSGAYTKSVNPSDVPGIVSRAKVIYKEMQNMDDVHNLKDLDGYMTKPMNPGKWGSAVLQAADEVSVEKNKEWDKLNETPLSIPFSEIVKKDLRDNTVNSFSKGPNK